ncbi:hypothetical protein [Microcystis sp. M061S2]|uniref:hypothetical protein n=1 Tax=Microcystis sp. M061S2 TaxID=2771171 RepID=UPI00258B6A4C|nr:hypothetical protein [Microcystis sp. M061S2]MCA2654530.1 hypothetical protein [Microcystis sp. M061S2]
MLQEKKDSILALVDEVYALGVQAGQSGGAVYTQEQYDQAIQAVSQQKDAEKVQALAALKQLVVDKINAQKASEDALEAALVAEVSAL